MIKAYRIGTHRARTPAETLEHVLPLLPHLGITRVANVTGLDRIGIPVVMVVRPNARSLSVSQGKGVDVASARVSGIMESMEAWHAENMEHPQRVVSYDELRVREPVVDVTQLPKPSAGLFSADLPVVWVMATELNSVSSRQWVPHELVHTRYVRPAPPGSGSFLLSSNGLASGNIFLEAVLHGICETIERDSTALWENSSPQVRAAARLRLDTVDDAVCQGLLERFLAAEVRVAVWETTTDIEVPCFVCLAVERCPSLSWKVVPEGWGMGCHPSRGVALARALTEAAQSRLTMIAGTRDDLRRGDYARHLTRDYQAGLQQLERSHQPQRDYSQIPDWESEGIDTDVERVCSQLKKAGMDQVLVVDLSRPEGGGMAVVRVLVPGLEGPSESSRYTPGLRALKRRALS